MVAPTPQGKAGLCRGGCALQGSRSGGVDCSGSGVQWQSLSLSEVCFVHLVFFTVQHCVCTLKGKCFGTVPYFLNYERELSSTVGYWEAFRDEGCCLLNRQQEQLYIWAAWREECWGGAVWQELSWWECPGLFANAWLKSKLLLCSQWWSASFTPAFNSCLEHTAML